MKHTIRELQELQALPLDLKVRLTKQRIREWIREFGEDGVYVSFSGGKDSTVLLDIVREEYPMDTELKKIVFRFNVFQRIEYLLHIPVAMMEKGSPVYDDYRIIAKWMKKNWLKAMGNPYLTKKNKAYHTLFAVAPKGVRRIHKKIKKL